MSTDMRFGAIPMETGIQSQWSAKKNPTPPLNPHVSTKRYRYIGNQEEWPSQHRHSSIKSLQIEYEKYYVISGS